METGFNLTSTLTDITSIASACWDIIQQNPVLMICFAGCIVGVGFNVVSRAKAAAA